MIICARLWFWRLKFVCNNGEKRRTEERPGIRESWQRTVIAIRLASCDVDTDRPLYRNNYNYVDNS